MAFVTPHNIRLSHLQGRNGRHSNSIKRAAGGGRGAPEVFSVTNKNGVLGMLVVGRNFISFPGYQTNFQLFDVSGSTTITPAQILAASGTLDDDDALIPGSLIPDRNQMQLIVSANNQSVSFIIL